MEGQTTTFGTDHQYGTYPTFDPEKKERKFGSIMNDHSLCLSGCLRDTCSCTETALDRSLLTLERG